MSETSLGTGNCGVVHRIRKCGWFESAFLQLFLASFLFFVLLLELTCQVVEDQQIRMRNHSICRDAVIKLWIVFQKLIDFLQHLFAVSFSQLFAGLVDTRVMLLCLFNYSLSLLLLGLLASGFAEESIAFEEIKVFLQLATLWLIKSEFQLRRWGLSLLEVNGIDVVHTNDSQKKDADIFSIDLIPLQSLVSLMNKSSFQTVLSFLLNACEAHFLQYLIE